MMKYLFSCAFSAALTLCLFIGIPLNGNAHKALSLDTLDGNNLTRLQLRIAYVQCTNYDYENDNGLVALDSGMIAPCLSMFESSDSCVIYDFFYEFPLKFYVNHDAGTAFIPSTGIELLSDSVIGTAANRVDTVRWAALISRDYVFFNDATDITGTIDEDGTVTFNNGNGFLYFGYEVLRTYKYRRLQSVDTIWFESPVFEGLTLLEPNANHEFHKIYYPTGLNPLTPDNTPDNPDSPGEPNDSTTHDTFPELNDSLVVPTGTRPYTVSDLSGHGGTAHPQDWRGGSSGPIKPGDGGIVPRPFPGGGFRPKGGGSLLNGKDLEDLLNDHNNSFSSTNPNGNSNNWKKLRERLIGFDGTCGFGRGGSGRPIKPITGEGDQLRSGNMPTLHDAAIVDTEVTNKVYMFQGEDESQGKYVCVLNLYGTGQVNYFYLRDNGVLDFPIQPIGMDDETGHYFYNYTSSTGRIDELEEGNTGTATAEVLTWGLTVPNDPLNPIVVVNEPDDGMTRAPMRGFNANGSWWASLEYLWMNNPYFYDVNKLYFTDGQQFNVPVPETLNVSAVSRKIDSALRGEGSIGEVTEIIDKLLNAGDKQ